MNKIEKIELGTFKVKDKIVISDPCYDKTNGFNIIKKAKEGTWKALIEVSNEGNWGKRVKNLFVCNDEYDFLDSETTEWELIGSCGVDSGQLGVFAEEIYKNNNAKCLDNIQEAGICKDDKFYNRMCFLTLGNDEGNNTFGGVFEKGVNVSSGFGDGQYNVYGIFDTHEPNHKLIAVWVSFFGEDEDEEDYEDEDYNVE